MKYYIVLKKDGYEYNIKAKKINKLAVKIQKSYSIKWELNKRHLIDITRPWLSVMFRGKEINEMKSRKEKRNRSKIPE